MTPERPRVLGNLSGPQVLAQMQGVLAGELSGPGGEHVSEAREHTRAALRAGPHSPAYFAALAQAQAALERAVSERPHSPTVFAREVLGVTPTPSGARLTLAEGEGVTLSAASAYHLTLSTPARLARLDVPALYVLPAHLIRPAALALGFRAEQLAGALDEQRGTP